MTTQELLLGEPQTLRKRLIRLAQMWTAFVLIHLFFRFVFHYDRLETTLIFMVGALLIFRIAPPK
ncbi:hypothetical protein CCAX7_55580 [Capsulimonas corticalis]|uniref:Uncharacterized protein n=1 Tax=Capsulimonas corticalis TaxID=2219043 RepID=A0A402D0Y5_9BACT|nr:hypothetical protein [Capsulimonas corticalis]BDI33507.1 hypothetical protein CCAX7_55580 [Capsulimonas corticalis]